MEFETWLLIGAALVGIVVGLLHLVGYVPPRYRRMLREVQADTAKAISSALEGSLARFLPEDGSESVLDPSTVLAPFLARLEALPQAIKEALTPSPAEQEELIKRFAGSAATGIPENVLGAIGGSVTQDRRKDRELTDAIGQGLLGPYGPILEQVFPPLYDYLTANPDMVVRALEMPVVQRLIQQGSRSLGGLLGKGGGGSSEKNPFLTE